MNIPTLTTIHIIDKPFKCLKCGAVLGLTDGLIFHTKDFKVKKVITVQCLSCGTERVWRPVTTPRGGEK